jgi:hypothetical protein
MYEMTPAQTVHAMQQYEACSWVAVLRSDQTSKALKDGRRLGRLGQRFVKGAKIMMKKRWWEPGERTDIKSNGTYEIWYSRREELEVITLELPSLMWMPYKHCAQCLYGTCSFPCGKWLHMKTSSSLELVRVRGANFAKGRETWT